MTNDQARRLKAAVTAQDQQRKRLISAEEPELVRTMAEAYLRATDRCYELAVEIKGAEEGQSA